MRRKSFSVQYLFVIAVAVFASWVYFYEYKGGESREKEKAEASALLPFSNSNIVGIRIRTRQAGATFADTKRETVLEKVGAVGDGDQDSVWKVVSPYTDTADTSAVESFLAGLSAEKFSDVVIEGAGIAWKTYGLDQPLAEVELAAKDPVKGSKEIKRLIQIGSVEAYDGSVYGRIDNQEKVVLLSSSAEAVLQKDPREFRDKRFFPAKAHPEFTALEISRQGYSKIEFVRKDGVWSRKGAKPGSWPLDQGAVTSYTQAVAGLRGNDVWAENKSDAQVLKLRKLDRAGLTIGLSPGYVVKLAQLGNDETVTAGYGSARPLIFSVYKAQFDLLSKAEEDFLDLSYPFQFKIADVEAVELERPAGAVSLPSLIKKEGRWIVDPMDAHFQEREADSNVVDRLLAEISSLKASRVAPASAIPPKISNKGALRVGIFGAKNKKLAELVFAPQGELVQVSSSLTPGRVFEIEKSRFESLSLDVINPAAQAPSPSPLEKGKP